MNVNEMVYTTVGDVTIGFRFGMQAVLELDGLLGDSEDTKLPMELVTKVAWAGYKNWCFAVEQPHMTFLEFNDFLDQAFAEQNNVFATIMTAFENSRVINSMKTKPDDNESKKKTPTKRPQKK
jgi:hypothetical protein